MVEIGIIQAAEQPIVSVVGQSFMHAQGRGTHENHGECQSGY